MRIMLVVRDASKLEYTLRLLEEEGHEIYSVLEVGRAQRRDITEYMNGINLQRICAEGLKTYMDQMNTDEFKDIKIICEYRLEYDGAVFFDDRISYRALKNLDSERLLYFTTEGKDAEECILERLNGRFVKVLSVIGDKTQIILDINEINDSFRNSCPICKKELLMHTFTNEFGAIKISMCKHCGNINIARGDKETEKTISRLMDKKEKERLF